MQVPLREPYRITLPTGVMVRRSAQHSAIVTAFLDVVSAMYGDARRPATLLPATGRHGVAGGSTG